jgi:ribosomal silencing factor RsfS
MLPTKFWFIVQAISDPRGKDFLEIDLPEARNSYDSKVY